MEKYITSIGVLSGIAEWSIPPISFLMGILLIYWWLIIPPILSAVLFLLLTIGKIIDINRNYDHEITSKDKGDFLVGFISGFFQAVFNTFLLNGFLFGVGAVISSTIL